MPRKSSWVHKVKMKYKSHVSAQTGISLDVQPKGFEQGKHLEKKIFFLTKVYNSMSQLKNNV